MIEKDPSSTYPRVLIVNMSCINRADQHAVSLRNWFADWPKENLAQIYSGNDVGEEKFCGFTFKLGVEERRFGRLFFRIKGSPLGEGAGLPSLMENLEKSTQRARKFSSLKRRTSEILVNSGLWEVIFRPVLSPKLVKWIEDFQPDVIYCQGYNLSFAWLPLAINRRINIPICFHTTDDWPGYLYKESILSFIMRRIVNQTATRLIRTASLRLAFSDAMAKEYEKRYAVPFETLMICDDFERFVKSKARRTVDESKISIVYSGNLALGRWKSLIDICRAAQLIKDIDRDIIVSAYVTAVPSQAIDILKSLPNLRLLPPLSHEDVPGYLKGADILFLPEPFEPEEALAIKLSISTKAMLYMMSQRPVLMYASSIAGVAEYAKREKWAYVVDKQDTHLLAEAIRQIIRNKDITHDLVTRGIEVAMKNHNQRVIRQKLLNSMNAVIQP